MPSIYKNGQRYAGYSLDLSHLVFNSLTTNSKNIVTAVNEIDERVGHTALTTNSTTITSAINELKGNLANLNYSDISGTVPETDPVFAASPAADITASDILSWKNANSIQWNNTSKELRVSKNNTMTTVFSKTDLGSMPASDVYDWAKATTKPSYSFTEITGTVPSSALPSYVDDVVEYGSVGSFPVTGESDKIYIDISTNLTYRWSGSTYVQISSSLALGTTSSTAFRGDWGNAAYQHAVTNKGAAFTNGLYKFTTNSEGHITAATEVVKADITALGIPAQDTTYESLSSASGGTTESLVTTGEKYTWDNKADTISATITLNSSDWSSNSQTVNVTGVTSNNTIIVSPTAAGKTDYINYGVWCTEQGSGTLTFTCETTPASNIGVNILIISSNFSSDTNN